MRTNSSDSSPGHFPLLALPRELRDIIYHYALSYDRGLAVEISCNRAFEPRTHMRILGQHDDCLTQTRADILKLVCAQLRDDTRGLIFKLNSEVDLHGMSYATPSSYSFRLFISQLPSEKFYVHLKRVTIHGYPGVISTALMPMTFKELAGYAAGFKTFCEQYQKTLVVLQFRNIVQVDSNTWYFWAGALQEVLRGASPLITPRTRPRFAKQLLHISTAFANTPPAA
ncbi:uncharacterized protein K460DRAFT_353539 [Cucurbitaria berberidis CBS 394.84]|uniref:Uncharacterized protein n=1 Tax=Cucurbitaria berberidis CBS 394.84 TaxID=1168544 RepID=A0A9P4LBI5_9PLEO|nr:uncharacterized protein K460DRAFT_353539 [Cucurbitaria berberidis CBS 394.84]KAF1848573.1 hypothetical protein K460DRAFT_353539 [Cucurbitaria berberidis CBS 394.84]